MLTSGDYREKRDFIRMCVECPVLLQVPGGDTLEGRVKNLSATGMLVLCPEPLSEGTELQITIQPGSEAIAPLDARVRVVRLVELEDGYELGLAISKMG